MRTSRRRLPPLLSPHYCRCSRFLPELGFEIFCNDRMADCASLAFDQAILGRSPGTLCTSVASLSARQHSLFLCRQLLGEIDSCRSKQALRRGPRRNRSRSRHTAGGKGPSPACTRREGTATIGSTKAYLA